MTLIQYDVSGISFPPKIHVGNSLDVQYESLLHGQLSASDQSKKKKVIRHGIKNVSEYSKKKGTFVLYTVSGYLSGSFNWN